ncbi:MAG: TIGR03087 family PEP-CTERM/XrtA system glycosyltransferase [Burkholderiaceae bacterium]
MLLAHRIPFPPDKGDKIRSYHLLRHLARRYDVHLAAFVDDPRDRRHEGRLRELCTDLFLAPIDPRWRRLASLSALLSREPLSLRFFADRRLQAWVDQTLARQPFDAVVTYSSTMARFVAGPAYESLNRIADFIDVDSEKWAQYARTSRWPGSWIYGREARTLLAYERRIAARFHRTLFVSAAEAQLFVERAPECAGRVGYFSNGVDTDYFDPAIAQADPDPYPAGGPVAVFTGAMDYRPNIEAVQWFAEEILPLLRRSSPQARFYIVGSNPARAVRQLAEADGVTVTGRVEDVRPYLRHAQAVVAPLRIARGIQNKVLEAMAMSRPVVSTAAAAEGIDPQGQAIHGIADSPQAFADATARAFEAGVQERARALVVQSFSWESHLRQLDTLIAATRLGCNAAQVA